MPCWGNKVRIYRLDTLLITYLRKRISKTPIFAIFETNLTRIGVQKFTLARQRAGIRFKNDCKFIICKLDAYKSGFDEIFQLQKNAGLSNAGLRGETSNSNFSITTFSPSTCSSVPNVGRFKDVACAISKHLFRGGKSAIADHFQLPTHYYVNKSLRWHSLCRLHIQTLLEELDAQNAAILAERRAAGDRITRVMAQEYPLTSSSLRRG